MHYLWKNKRYYTNAIFALLILVLILTPMTVSADSKSGGKSKKKSIKIYQVKFNATGGKAARKSKKVKYKKKYGALPKASKTGYDFNGWFTAKQSGSKITTKTKYKKKSGQTLYARWKAKSVDIKFNGNGGTASYKSKTLKYDQKYKELPTATREGIKFLGWYTKKSGGTKITSNTTVKFTGRKTLYAKWEGIYELEYNYRNGKKGTSGKEFLSGDTYGELPKTTRTNYVFKGWYTEKYGGKEITPDAVITATKDITIYARWDWKMSISKMYTTKGSAARSGKKRTGFAGVTIHNTGNSSETATALSHGIYLQGNGKNRRASWHYCVDDKIATYSIPEAEIAWHAGDGKGKGNYKTIGIEICMNKGGDLFDATENGAKLAADILHRNGITKAVNNVNIYQHNYFSSYGKNCPQMIRAGKPYSWSTFIKRVNYYLNDM